MVYCVGFGHKPFFVTDQATLKKMLLTSKVVKISTQKVTFWRVTMVCKHIGNLGRLFNQLSWIWLMFSLFGLLHCPMKMQCERDTSFQIFHSFVRKKNLHIFATNNCILTEFILHYMIKRNHKLWRREIWIHWTSCIAHFLILYLNNGS